MKKQRISTKIKTLGALFAFLVVALIMTTIYLNEKTKHDALIVNIAGKERMLSQRIAKNVFYIYQTKQANFVELDNAIHEFIYGLNTLKHGNNLLGIESSPTEAISTQFYIIDVLWESYFTNLKEFKRHMLEASPEEYQKAYQNFNVVYHTNDTLLNEVDKLVTLYTTHAQNKTQYLIYFQYAAALTMLILFIYAFFKLKTIEQNAQEFIQSTKQLMDTDDVEELKPLHVNAESEIVEVSDTINCFINKISSAMNYSAQAIEQSKQASLKLEEITDEFDDILENIKDSANLSKELNRSEDMVIESTEELMNSTKRLEELKAQLDKLKEGCLKSE